MKEFSSSIYSDSTKGFVSNPTPKLGDTITISIRFLQDPGVSKVFLWRLVNCAENYIPMEYVKTEGGLSYYQAQTTLNEPKLQYHFVIIKDDELFFYTQAGVFSYVPDYRHDFVIRTDYVKPAWVDGAVFYQIFPERFCNGDPSNDVREGEYEYGGQGPIVMKDWKEKPLDASIARGMDFYGGDLQGVKEKIPYLKELGVTAVYLNPIFSAYSAHKYDCIDYFHVDEHFGGDEALADLSRALHENDMKLVLDISINHTGIENEWTRSKREFYFKKPDGALMGWAGFSSLPTLDYRNEELRDLIYRRDDSVLRKWLKPPYNIDGWRFDVADVFARNDDVQLADEVWREVCAAIREVKRDAIIIGEHWADCHEYLQGDLWNTPMNYYGFGRIMRQFAGLHDLFLERNKDIAAADKGFSAKELVARADDHYNGLSQAIADCQMNLFDSHDVSRVHNFESVSFEKYRGVVMSYLLFTGIPCIYYGDELGIDGHTLNDSGCRYPMPWDRTGNDDLEYYALYKRMIELRKNTKAFSMGGRKVLFADGKLLVVARFMDDEKYIGIISMEDQARTIDIPLWQIGAADAFADTDEFGRSFSSKALDGVLTVDVPADGAYIIRVD